MVSTGCQSRAHRDIYHQRMANEIRVLEDQLYDADYQNRVLRDKIERDRARKPNSATRQEKARGFDSHVPPAEPSPISDPSFGENESFESYIDPGQPADSEPWVDPGELESGSVFPDSEAIPVPTPDPDSSRDDGRKTDSEKDKTELLPPAPGLPEPPGPDDLTIPPIIPGEILPPPMQGDEPEKPPGQVELPESLQAKTKLDSATAPPEKLQIHPGISGGHQFDEDDEVDGLFVVVNALDKHNRMVDLTTFDIDATMTLVVLDPALPASEAKIGRWEFTSDEVDTLVRSHPVSGLHVPVKWQETRPIGDEVIVHVRLSAGDEEMRCEGRLRVDQSAATAKWTPRGESILR